MSLTGLPLGPLVALVVVLLILAALLAAADAACNRVSPGRAEELFEQGRRGAAALQRVVADPAPPILVATFLRVLCDMSSAVLIALLSFSSGVARWWQAVLISVAISTAAVFVVVGVGPRTYARQHADAVGLVAAPALLWLSRVLGPLARILVLIGNALTPGKGYRDGPFASEAELREFVDMASERQLIEADEREMIQSVFDLGDTLTREVMVPRTDLVSVGLDTTLHQAMSLFLRSGFSRVPVFGEDPDDVRGVLYLKDVARKLHEDGPVVDKVTVEQLLREAPFVPDSKRAGALLREMQARDVPHVAIVVDEYGGTAGMVTLEDLVEEIVGEISDEYDRADAEVEDLGEGRFRVSARLHIEDMGELFDLELEDDDVDTVGGLLAKALGRVPIANATAQVSGLRLTADAFEGRRHRLASVIVERVRRPAPENAS